MSAQEVAVIKKSGGAVKRDLLLAGAQWRGARPLVGLHDHRGYVPMACPHRPSPPPFLSLALVVFGPKVWESGRTCPTFDRTKHRHFQRGLGPCSQHPTWFPLFANPQNPFRRHPDSLSCPTYLPLAPRKERLRLGARGERSLLPAASFGWALGYVSTAAGGPKRPPTRAPGLSLVPSGGVFSGPHIGSSLLRQRALQGITASAEE